MSTLHPEEIRKRIERRDPQTYRALLEENGAALYTFCFRLSLGNARYAQELFRLSLVRAFKNTSLLKQSTSIWIFGNLYKTWQWYHKDKKSLGTRTSYLTFDWSRRIGQQTEDCLELLTPMSRIHFLLRVMKKFSLREVCEIAQSSESRILSDLENTFNRLIST